MEAQSSSRDEYSRKSALEAKSSGHIAVFDPQYTSSGLSLSCGNHCVMKVGNGLCCGARSMIPIDTAKLVYVEFSVTASCAQVPSISIGLAPAECPLNVMVSVAPVSMAIVCHAPNQNFTSLTQPEFYVTFPFSIASHVNKRLKSCLFCTLPSDCKSRQQTI